MEAYDHRALDVFDRTFEMEDGRLREPVGVRCVGRIVEGRVGGQRDDPGSVPGPAPRKHEYVRRKTASIQEGAAKGPGL